MPSTFEQELQNLRRNQRVLIFLILLFVVVLFWVFTSIATTQSEKHIDPKLIKLAIPLSPNLNLDVLKKLEFKNRFSDEELENFPIFKILVSRNGTVQEVVPLDVSLEDIENRNTENTIQPTSAPTASVSSQVN